MAYLDFEHTLDAWYRHTSSTNSGRPGTILSSTTDYLQGIHHWPGTSCPLAIASLLGGRCTWLLVRIYAFLRLIQFPQGFETQDSEWTRSSFVRASGWSSRGLATDEIGESPKWREWEIWRAHWREAEGGRLTGVRQRRHRGEDDALMRTGWMTIASLI